MSATRRARTFATPTIHDVRPSVRLGEIRWSRVAKIGVAALFIAGLFRATHFLFYIPDLSASLGIDFRLYMDTAREWLATGSMFRPYQLAGPYALEAEPIYPPVALWLFVPFTVLPGILWWGIPIALTVAQIWRWRPSSWALGAIGLILLLPISQDPIFWGNPVIWLLPAIAWGIEHGWIAALVLVKPSLAPFALAGLRRPWRLAGGVLVFLLACVPFGAQLWSEWIAAILNANAGLAYNITQVPLLMIPILAWLGRHRVVMATA